MPLDPTRCCSGAHLPRRTRLAPRGFAVKSPPRRAQACKARGAGRGAVLRSSRPRRARRAGCPPSLRWRGRRSRPAEGRGSRGAQRRAAGALGCPGDACGWARSRAGRVEVGEGVQNLSALGMQLGGYRLVSRLPGIDLASGGSDHADGHERALPLVAISKATPSASCLRRSWRQSFRVMTPPDGRRIGAFGPRAWPMHASRRIAAWGRCRASPQAPCRAA